MKKYRYILLTIILGITASSNYAQNLIPNYSFEVYDTCPYSAGQIYYALPWTDPSNATSDYYNSCNLGGAGVPNNFAGNENAKDGNAYAGLAMYVDPSGTEYREYIQVPLSSSLVASECYRVIFYVSVTDEVKYGITNLGVYFSTTPVTTCLQCIMPYTPQINHFNPSGIGNSSGWTKIEGTFIASGGEQYLTLGNFNDDLSTAPVIVNPGKPGWAAYYIDSVSLTVCDTSNGINEINYSESVQLFPNPNEGSMTLNYLIKQNDKALFKLYDITGRIVKEVVLDSMKDRLQINTNFSKGIYMYQLIVNDIVIQSDKLIIIK